MIASPVKNCEIYLENSFRIAYKIAESFSDYQIVIAESNSDDNTAAKLHDYSAKDPKMTVYSEGKIECGSRTMCIGRARNKLLWHFLHNATGLDFMLQMDFDDRAMGKRVQQHTLAKLWAPGIFEHWSTVSFMQLDMYDGWALREIGDPFSCLWNVYRNGKYYKGFDRCIENKKRVHAKLKRLPPGSLYPVISAFGFTAIYKREAIGPCTYSENDDCEHASFHMCICSRARPSCFFDPNEDKHRSVNKIFTLPLLA
mmetsp:Transcript_1166/g.4729  ORF Transcript_1166/g.4729 Transcript_1166/m.4729 type:complete len:256 (-) Transcript_1166:168-935(-)